MAERSDNLRLLTRLLPIDSLGPNLCRAARQAVASGDEARQHRVARAIVGELQRRGELVRVAIEGRPPAGALYLLRGSTRLLDLSGLLRESDGCGTALPAAPAVMAPAAPIAVDDTDAADALPRLLLAMEQAQSLALGEAPGRQPSVLLEDILALLARALPQRRLAALLEGEADPGQPVLRVALRARGAGEPFWAAHRLPGAGIWLDAASELPVPLRRALGADDARPFTGAAGVALLAPRGEPPRPEEAGLLLVAATHPVRPGRLLRDARLISRFVTARWRQQRDMSQLVHTDSLTGAHNRASFDAQLALELERARRRESPLTLVLADIDHFKRINDSWGHPAGDGVLRTVVRELQRGLRRIDLVCRIGGEEFALILPDTPPAAAQEVCLRLLERIDRLRLTLPGAPESLRVSLSYGGVTFPDGGTDPVELYRKADGMLYLSKRGGRNRCTFWNPQGEPLVLASPLSAGN